MCTQSISSQWYLQSDVFIYSLNCLIYKGHAHNQLGIIYTQSKENLKAIYYYLLSLCCRLPSETSAENLKIFFEKKKLKDDFNGGYLSELGDYYLGKDSQINWRIPASECSDDEQFCYWVIIHVTLNVVKPCKLLAMFIETQQLKKLVNEFTIENIIEDINGCDFFTNETIQHDPVNANIKVNQENDDEFVEGEEIVYNVGNFKSRNR